LPDEAPDLVMLTALFPSLPRHHGRYRFYLLYDKMYREDVLAHAYALVKSNQGAPGVDGQSFRGIESQGLEEWLSGIRNDLRAKTYQPRARTASVATPSKPESHKLASFTPPGFRLGGFLCVGASPWQYPTASADSHPPHTSGT